MGWTARARPPCDRAKEKAAGAALEGCGSPCEWATERAPSCGKRQALAGVAVRQGLRCVRRRGLMGDLTAAFRRFNPGGEAWFRANKTRKLASEVPFRGRAVGCPPETKC